MIIPNCRVESWSMLGSLRVQLPAAFTLAADNVLTRCAKNHAGFVKVSIDIPSRPKTDGEKSQNNHAWGHATQIASGLNQGDDPRDVLYDACIATPGYPSRMNKFGRVVAQSWSLATTAQAAAVIDTLHRLAAEFGIVLVEGKET